MGTQRFSGQSAIVTGGASGIGRALGAALHHAGAHVVLADLDGEAATEAAREIGGDGSGPGSVAGVILDVSDRQAVEEAVEAVCRARGGLDLMINNAGISLGGQSHQMPAEHWDRIIEVNLRGVVNGVLAAYPRMVARGRGHLVNVASMAGLAPTPLTAAYSMTKHGVVGLTTTLRPEAAIHGVRATVVCPGSIETPILDKAPAADLPPAPAGTLTPRQFLDHLHMRPMDVDRFAAQALRGIARNRAVVIVPRSGRGLWYLQRAAPGAVRGMGGLLARRVVRDIDRA